jgi:hypothetical protein
VKAPPDLVDDDVVTPKPDEPGAAPPKPAPLPKKPEPELDQFGKPKPRDRAFIQAERERNIAKQKRDYRIMNAPIVPPSPDQASPERVLKFRPLILGASH